MNGSIDYFADAVFNYPTLAECYKVAALDGINRTRSAASQAAPSAESISTDRRVDGSPKHTGEASPESAQRKPAGHPLNAPALTP